MARYQRELSVAIAFAGLLIVVAIARPDFYTGDKLQSILVQSAPVLMTAIGMTLVILSRHIDISIGSQWSLCGVVCGLLAKSGLPMPLTAIGTVIAGGLLGAINGGLVAFLGLPSIVVTLATMVIFREALRWLREGEAVRNLPDHFQWFGFSQAEGQWLLVGIAVAIFLSFAWGLRYTAAGRTVYATGSDPDAAFLVGIRPKRVVFSVFVLMGALTGLAAMLNAIRFPIVIPTEGTGMELKVIAAAVVGGVAISGGRGTLLGALIGVLLLATIGPALVFMGAPPYWEKTIQGAIILIAVASDALTFKRRKHASAANSAA
jgi:rhamnose transport system permease protein